MPKESAGLVCYRRDTDGLKVLLVHPGGPFWTNKDFGAWSIPKGEIVAGEDALAAARREFQEELGAAPPDGPAIALEPVRQAGGKIVHAWACQADFDPATLQSATFSMEWPPKSGRQQSFPEVDRAAWFSLVVAKRKILSGQAGLIDQLENHLARQR